MHTLAHTSAGQLWSDMDRANAGRRLEDRQFSAMAEAYGRTGGLVPGDDLAGRLRRCCNQPLSQLARWLVAREVIGFEWRGQTLLPLFQFDVETFQPRPDVAAVLRELTCVFDDWELAWWFANPNAWLKGQAPVDVLGVDPRAVVEAARADRYVAVG